MTNNTTIKFLAVATLSLSALGTAAVLPASHADAASVTQKSGNESVGKIEAITNTFKTFDTAENFLVGELPKILKGQSYDGHVFPAAQTGYNVSATIDYDALTSKSQAQNLANKVVQAADAAIAAEAKADTAKPAEPNKPADNTVTPAEPNKPADNVVTPAEPNKPADNTVTPEKPNKPAEDTAKPADNTVTPADTTKPAEDTAKPAEQTKPVDGSTQADTTKPATDLVKPDKPGEQPAKPTEKDAKLGDKSEKATKDANKLKDGEVLKVEKDQAQATKADAKDAAKAEKADGKSVNGGESTLPKTAATSSSIANLFMGVIAIMGAAIVGLRKKLFR